MEKYRNLATAAFVLGIIGILGIFLLSYIALGLAIYCLIQLDKDEMPNGRVFALLGLLLGAAGVLVNMNNHGFFG